MKENSRLLKAKAKVLKAMGHPTRLWIIEELSRQERCVCELVDGIGADFSTVSKHLTVLKEAGLVSDKKNGKQVIYNLKVPCVLNFINCIESVIRNQFEENCCIINE